MDEIWKDVPDYIGIYQISNLGNARSLDRYVKHPKKGYRLVKGIDIKQSPASSGYNAFSLCKEGTQKTILTHLLVAKLFVDNPNNKPYVNHIDGDKTNCKSDNLEWCTPKENYDHSVANKLQGYRKTPILQLDLNGNLIKEYESQIKAEEETKICRKQINNCAKNKQPTAKGFKWQYKKD